MPAGVRARMGLGWQRLAVLVPYLWLLAFFLAPFAIVVKISFADPIIAQPPFTPLLDLAAGAGERLRISFDNYRFLFVDDLYWITYLRSLRVALVSTLLCLLIGYPMAYAMARARPRLRNVLLLLVILPFWSSFLLRVYAWMGILNTHGYLSSVLQWAGVVDAPLRIMYTDLAMYIGIVYSYLPFMVLPLYSTLERLDFDLNEAAADLGARPGRAFVDVTLPLSLPGIVAGCLLVFIPAMGEFVIPVLLGGPDSLMIGRVLYDEFFVNRDWPLAAAAAVVLLAILVAPIVLFQHLHLRAGEQTQ
ncbi:MAG: ABC transporter permease subunit [Gammaproteobacteria bacterium]|nr:ABC transporter permease subunit [Gammaproteobacteria bacterium]